MQNRIDVSKSIDNEVSLTLTARVGKGGRLRVQLGPLGFQQIITTGLARGVTFLEVGDAIGSFREFHLCTGGYYWRPVVHQLKDMARHIVQLRIKRLTPANFLGNLSPIVFRNPSEIPWSPEASTTEFELEGKTLNVKIGGYARNGLFEEIILRGDLDSLFEVSDGKPRLGFTLKGLLGGKKRLAIYQGDHGIPRMGMEDGRQFRTVKLIYSDGVRLRIVYDKFRAFNISTLYTRNPGELYRVDADDVSERFGDVSHWRRYSVHLRRKIEALMLYNGTSYDHGRLGVEIAYSIVKKLYPVSNFVIPEMSKGGRDLFSSDGRISVQARLIYDFRQFRPMGVDDVLRVQLKSLLRKLGQDFAYNPDMSIGLASLSYFGKDRELKTILSRRQRTATAVSRP
jgi:hypothetical protein